MMTLCTTAKCLAFYIMESGSEEDATCAVAQEDIVSAMLKVPKGTRDYAPAETRIRQEVIDIAVQHYKRHGAVTFDTPVFEMRSLLQKEDQYGEETKLIYNLEDQGGEEYSLRYDLTVPLARYVGMNKLGEFKRYHVAKVYRRDQPAMARGRYREFYQCDYDYVGQSGLMIADSECMKIIDDIFLELDLGEFVNKVNHKVLLNGMLEVCQIPSDKFKTVCSSIDKLDKQPWVEVRDELVNVKNIHENAVDALHGFLTLRAENPKMSNDQVLDTIFARSAGNANVEKGISELRTLLEYCTAYGISERICIEPSLARGLDYYTGVIFEMVITKSSFENAAPNAEESQVKKGKADKKAAKEDSNVGSVAAGGRYDGLVKSISKFDAPCVGFSLGIERIYRLVQRRNEARGLKVRDTDTDVYVAVSGRKEFKDLFLQRMTICTQLWKADIKTEYAYKAKPKLLNQLQYCEQNGIATMIIIGEDEVARGVVKLRDVASRAEEEIPISDVVVKVLERLGRQ
ncbi:hypothetical protein QR680_005294 [Steinernema hermaphroditum]|uniref:histidine--tRNA ligase n=1 Tax=Steinernema hermaphroditum TaxID=289476 RepID=A0AA39LV41_9BILA|nr:hypothetical protein QR680_005294 [Steinernema hermaphroditum]